MPRLPAMLVTSAVFAAAVTGALAQTAGNPLLGDWELKAEDGFIRYQGKIKCDVVFMRFDGGAGSRGSEADGAGAPGSPALAAPNDFVFIMGGNRVQVVRTPYGSRVDYVFISLDEIGVDNVTGCKYRPVGSREPSLAEHEAAQAAAAGQAAAPGGLPLKPAASSAASQPSRNHVMTYDEAIDAIDKMSREGAP